MNGMLRVAAELIAEPEGGYTIHCPGVDIHTQGETEAGGLDNLREPAELHLEPLGAQHALHKVIRRGFEAPRDA